MSNHVDAKLSLSAGGQGGALFFDQALGKRLVQTGVTEDGGIVTDSIPSEQWHPTGGFGVGVKILLTPEDSQTSLGFGFRVSYLWGSRPVRLVTSSTNEIEIDPEAEQDSYGRYIREDAPQCWDGPNYLEACENYDPANSGGITGIKTNTSRFVLDIPLAVRALFSGGAVELAGGVELDFYGKNAAVPTAFGGSPQSGLSRPRLGVLPFIQGALFLDPLKTGVAYWYFDFQAAFGVTKIDIAGLRPGAKSPETFTFKATGGTGVAFTLGRSSPAAQRATRGDPADDEDDLDAPPTQREVRVRSEEEARRREAERRAEAAERRRAEQEEQRREEEARQTQERAARAEQERRDAEEATRAEQQERQRQILARTEADVNLGTELRDGGPIRPTETMPPPPPAEGPVPPAEDAEEEAVPNAEAIAAAIPAAAEEVPVRTGPGRAVPPDALRDADDDDSATATTGNPAVDAALRASAGGPVGRSDTITLRTSDDSVASSGELGGAGGGHGGTVEAAGTTTLNQPGSAPRWSNALKIAVSDGNTDKALDELAKLYDWKNFASLTLNNPSAEQYVFKTNGKILSGPKLGKPLTDKIDRKFRGQYAILKINPSANPIQTYSEIKSTSDLKEFIETIQRLAEIHNWKKPKIVEQCNRRLNRRQDWTWDNKIQFHVRAI